MMLTSAFLPDGSVKPAWMSRLLRLARALDARGMMLHLICFYQHQDEALRDPPALRQGLRNVAGWLIEMTCAMCWSSRSVQRGQQRPGH
jgi:hypothetical protein